MIPYFINASTSLNEKFNIERYKINLPEKVITKRQNSENNFLRRPRPIFSDNDFQSSPYDKNLENTNFFWDIETTSVRNSRTTFNRRQPQPLIDGGNRWPNNPMFTRPSNVNRPTFDNNRWPPRTSTTTIRTNRPESTTQSSSGTPLENNCTRRCGSTPNVYNPVCGDDGITYPNPTRLECAQDCGIGKSSKFIIYNYDNYKKNIVVVRQDNSD